MKRYACPAIGTRAGPVMGKQLFAKALAKLGKPPLKVAHLDTRKQPVRLGKLPYL